MDRNLQEQVSYWKDTSLRDFETAKSLFKLKRYDACLFFCHLAVEKILKGVLVEKTNEPAPYTHNLSHLVEIAKIPVTKEQMAVLSTITTFNIAGRYDNVKQDFYKKCTKDFAEKHLTKSKQVYLWLEKQYQKR